MSEHFANEALTTLTAELAKGATTLTVASAMRFPAEGNFRILIDSELLMVTAVEGTAFTVERGIEETTDIPHASGSTVTQLLTAGGLANKADLDEGTLRESEIPSSVVLDSQVPAIYASRHGVSASNTGEENSEALASAIAEAEEQSRGRILLPNGVIALKSGFLLNKSDDEGGTFQYIFQGDGRGTILDLDGELDWLFRLNCTEADEAASATGNLIGRLQLRDLMIQGVENGETGLVRTIGASVQMSNIRGQNLNRGVYQIGGYADEHVFERVRWKADPEEQSWLFENKAQTNGDGHLFQTCEIATSKAVKLETCFGAVIDSCVGGTWDIRNCTGIVFQSCTSDNSVSGIENSAPWLRVENSRVKVSDGFLLVSQAHPLIEVDDSDELYDATQLVLASPNLGWIVGDPEVSPPRNSHLHIATASARMRLIFQNPRGFSTTFGTAVSDPIGVVVTSADENIQAAIDAAPELLNESATLLKEDSGWKIRPIGLRRATRQTYPPSLPSVSDETGIGGTLEEGITRYYCFAVWDGFQWSALSNEESAEAEKAESAFNLAIQARSANSKVRIWRGPEEKTFDAYCDITVPTAATRFVDTGDYLSGLPWITEEEAEVPDRPDPESNGQQTLIEHEGHRILWRVNAPGTGVWKQGDIVFTTNPEPGGMVGYICVESGPPSIWKAFGTIEE